MGIFQRTWGAVLLVAAAHISAQRLATHAPPASGSELDRFVEDKNYPALEKALPGVDLDPNPRLYFGGILADRLARFSEASRELNEVLPILRETHRHRAALALYALSQDEFMTGQYDAAWKSLRDLLEHYAKELSEADRKNARDDRAIFACIRSYPAQTVSGGLAFEVPVQRDAIGLMDVPVEAAGTHAWWIFDTGANITTISRSTAKQLGLTLSKGHAQTQSGATGLEVPLSTALIPELKVGTAVLHNAVALVLDDKDLDIGLGNGKHFQMQGILGYPALSSLGTFTVAGERMKVAPSVPSTARSTRLYVEQLTPMVEAGFEGKELLFQFDTGNSGAELTASFKSRFPEAVRNLPERNAQFGGAGQTAEITVVTVPKLELRLGATPAVLENVMAVGRDRGLAPLDRLYGNLGQALLKQFQGYTIDLNAMTFTPAERAK